jgi:hypothetical protein
VSRDGLNFSLKQEDNEKKTRSSFIVFVIFSTFIMKFFFVSYLGQSISRRHSAHFTPLNGEISGKFVCETFLSSSPRHSRSEGRVINAEVTRASLDKTISSLPIEIKNSFTYIKAENKKKFSFFCVFF